MEKVDFLIVLGGQVYEDGFSLILQYRLDKAVEYLKENHETLCIVSGGQGWNEPFVEAVELKDYLIQKGISEDRILLEDQAKNAKENIQFSLELVEDQIDDQTSFGLVINDFHMYRGKQISWSLYGQEILGLVAKSHLLYLPKNMLREFLALINLWFI